MDLLPTDNSRCPVAVGGVGKVREGQEVDGEDETERFADLSRGFLLSMAYAANVGGVSTLTGTTPNIILKGFVDE